MTTQTTPGYQEAQRLVIGFVDRVLPRLSETMAEKARAIRERVEAGDDYGAEDVTFEIDDVMSTEPERLTAQDAVINSWLSPMVERLHCVREPLILGLDGRAERIEPLGGGSQLDFLRRLVDEANEAVPAVREG